MSSQIYMFLIVVLIGDLVNDSYQPRENITKYMHASSENLYTKLVQLDQRINQQARIVEWFFTSLKKNEDTTTYTSPPTPKGTIM